MSTLHPDVEIPSDNNPKKKPETVLFYKKSKAGVNVIYQMTRKYSVKAAGRRPPEGGPFTCFTMLLTWH